MTHKGFAPFYLPLQPVVESTQEEDTTSNEKQTQRAADFQLATMWNGKMTRQWQTSPIEWHLRIICMAATYGEKERLDERGL